MPWARAQVATSVREGWGLNVSEAAACGTPSIGYDVPGLVDSIPASGGLLVEPTPAALAHGLTQVMDDAALAERFGAAGASSISALTWTAAVQRLMLS